MFSIARRSSIRGAHARGAGAAPGVSSQPRADRPVMSTRAFTPSETLQESRPIDAMHEFRVKWARDRQNAMTVDLGTLNDAPRVTDTALDEPWRMVEVPIKRLKELASHHYHYAQKDMPMWRIGCIKSVANCNPIDINPKALDSERMTRRPGQGRFDPVAPGAYGNRRFKYLFAIDHLGMHIAREMTPCSLDSRGVITHSKLVREGIIGGEIFFDVDDPGKVCINFGSARLPIEDLRQAERTAEFVLALGYHTVVAMMPDRDLSQFKYDMSDRYGSRVQNVVYRAQRVLTREDL